MAEKKKTRGRSLAGFFGASSGISSSASSSTSSSSEGTPVAAHVFSAKFLIGLVVVFFIAVAAYAPISTYVKQQAEINQVKDHIAALEAENKELNTQLSWWKDDNFVKQQAKSRLYFVSEGETPYLVVGTDFTSTLADDTSAQAQEASVDSWTNGLWNSFQSAALDENHMPEEVVAPEDSSPSTAP